MKTKVLIFGNEKNKITDLIKRIGFSVVRKNPDFGVSFGGDGTVMQSEAQFPGTPKIILKNSRSCKLCSPIQNEEILEKIKSGKYKIERFWKILGTAKDKKITAMSDITVHNGDPRHAIRYKFSVNGKQVSHEIIGDGVVVSTPLGSTGYYRSITDSFFEVGLGLAFNNSTEQADHMVLKENSIIKLEITRGPAIVFADNNPEKIILEVGNKITLQKSADFAQIVKVD